MRLIDDARAEEEDICAVAEAGAADIAAGRYTTVATPEDAILLHEHIMARLHARFTAGE